MAPIIEMEQQAFIQLKQICKTIHEGHQKHFHYLTMLLKFKSLDQLAPNWSELGFAFSLPKDVCIKSNASPSYLAGAYEFGLEE